MKKQNLNSSGIVHLSAILFALVLVSIVGVAILVNQHSQTLTAKGASASIKTTKIAPSFYFRSGAGDTDVGFVADYTLTDAIRNPRPVKPGSGTKFYYINLHEYKRGATAATPLAGPRVKLSTVDLNGDGKRSKDFGCGNSGLNHYRDSVAYANALGTAAYSDCTRGIFKVSISNLGRYKTYQIFNARQESSGIFLKSSIDVVVTR